MKVVDVAGLEFGEWDWSKLSFQLPESILMGIKSIPFYILTSSGEDRHIWNSSNHGEFDLKLAYALATKGRDEQGQFTGSWVWKVNTLPRINFFMWMCLHNSIRVGVVLLGKVSG